MTPQNHIKALREYIQKQFRKETRVTRLMDYTLALTCIEDLETALCLNRSEEYKTKAALHPRSKK